MALGAVLDGRRGGGGGKRRGTSSAQPIPRVEILTLSGMCGLRPLLAREAANTPPVDNDEKAQTKAQTVTWIME